MKTRIGVAVLALAFVVGCGSGPSSSSTAPPTGPSGGGGGSTGASPTPLMWATDGNPGVPICPAASPTNCVGSYTILDTNTQASFTVAITALSYMPANLTDSYEIRVNGFDGNGAPISSPYAAFPAAQ